MSGPKKIHLGFRIYLTYNFYKGDGLFSIRQYYLIEGKEVPSNRGVSMRHGNFSKLLWVIEDSFPGPKLTVPPCKALVSLPMIFGMEISML